MDATRRERIRSQITMMQSPGLARGVLRMMVALPAIIIVSVIAIREEIAQVWNSRVWWNAQVSTAVVREYSVDSTGDWPNLHYKHGIEYAYDVNGVVHDAVLILDSRSDRVAYVQDTEVRLSRDSKFAVYYLPHHPQAHSVFFDPRARFWGGMLRLAIVFGFVIVLAVTVTYLAFFRRQRRRIPMNAEFMLPKGSTTVDS